MEAGFQEIERALTSELLARLKDGPWQFFERVVLDLLIAMGYGGSREDAARLIRKAGDEGIDGTISEDRLGLDIIYVQAKRWEGSVGREVVQAFAGSLEGFKARKGVLLTTSKFTAGAQEYVRHLEKRIVLIDGDRLVQLMIEHGVGGPRVSTRFANLTSVTSMRATSRSPSGQGPAASVDSGQWR